MEVESVVIRRSPIPPVFKIVLAITLISLAYSIIAFGTDVLEQSSIRIFSLIEYDLTLFIGETLMNVLIAIFFMLQWAFDIYELRSGEIIHTKGILVRREERFSLINAETLSYNQGFFGRLFRYGTIGVFNPLLKTDIAIPTAIDPDKQMSLIRQAVRSSGNQKVIPMNGT
ncbi:MAG: PH domain-containing protein [Candidatus Peribacteraceae bacterium]